MAFAAIYDELRKRNAELLGLSVDSVSSHIAWLQNIEEKMGVAIPVHWRVGDPVVVPPPLTSEQAEERLGAGYDCEDGYLCTKKL